MKSSIYISSEQIQVIGYAGNTVKQYISRPLPEGTMINGKITEPALLTETLSDMRAEAPKLFQSSSLVVDGSAILVKRIAAPKLRKKQYTQLARDDYADSVDNLNDLVCGFHVMDGGGSILTCAADKSQIDSYVETFKAAGVSLDTIRVGAQAIINYVNRTPAFKNMTVVLNLVDGVTMLSMIFDKGVNVFMSRTRLYGEEKEQIIQNILENLSGLIQFNRSQKFDDITVSCYMGMSENDIRLLNAFSPYTDIKLVMLDIFGSAGSTLPPESHFCYLNTMLPNDSIDLMRCRRELAKNTRKKGAKKLWILALVFLLALLASPIGYMRYLTINLDAEIESAKELLQDPAKAAKIAEIDQLSAETAFYNNIISQYTEKILWEATKVLVSSSLLDLVTLTRNDIVTVTKFDYKEDSGSIRVEAECLSESEAAQYVEKLKENSMVVRVSYRGYGLNSSGRYSFGIEIILDPLMTHEEAPQ